MKAPIKEILDKLLTDGFGAILVDKGFVLSKKGIYKRKTRECNQELNVLLRRIHGQEAGYVQVCPGFEYEELEKLAAELRGEEPRKGWPTASANIGNLMPQRNFIEWPLTETTNIFALGELVGSYIKNYAFPFWEEFSTLEGLIQGYEKEDPRLTLAGNSYKWRMVAAYCLLKDYGAAIDTLKKWEKGNPALLQQAIKFVEEFLKGGY